MLTEIIIVIVFIILAVILAVELFIFFKNKKLAQDLQNREESAKYKMYEIEILNRLSEKTGMLLKL